MSRTEYDENNIHYTEYDSAGGGYYTNNNEYDNGSVYGSGNYYDNTYDRADIESKVISRSFIVMFVSLLITAFAATIVASNIDTFVTVLDSFSVLLIVEFVVVIATSYAVNKKNAVLAGVLFTAYSIINGMTLSVVFFAYELGSVQDIFVMTALLFGIMAVVGATTKINLSKIGGICTMLLLGTIIVTLANVLFLHSTGVDFVLDYVVVAIFVGLTAYDTQKMKAMAATTDASQVNSVAIYCGMELYLDFINLFLRLLAIFGKRKN